MATLNDIAKSLGYKDNAEGSGNAAFNMAASKSLAETYKANPNAATTVNASQQAKDAANLYNSNAARVNEALAATSGNNNNTNNSNNNASNYMDAYKSNVDTYKSSVANNSYDTYAKTESDRAAAEAEAIRARVRAAIAEGVSKQNKIIADAPGQFVDPMNRASYQGAKTAQAIDERMMAMGLGRSGSNITAQTSNANQTTANINDLENTKAKVISDAQQAIANLQASGSLEEVRLVQEAAAKSLERLQAQQNLIEGRQNDQALAIFNNANSALKTNYDIEANDRQLDMQERNNTANLTGIDPLTGQKTASQANFDKQFDSGEYWKNKEYDAQQAQQTWENTYKNNTFSYQKERDKVADSQFGQQYQLQLDKFAWDKSPDNPAIKSQVLDNQLKDLELQIQKDPNSPENQMKRIQLATAKDQLAKLQAITPEMTVKEYNAKLNEIYAGINASNASASAALMNAKTNQAQLGLDQAKFNYAKSTANSGSGASPSNNKSQYFDSINKDVSDFVKNTVENGKGDWINKPGSVEYNQIVNTVMNAPLQPWEKEYLLRQHNIPFK